MRKSVALAAVLSASVLSVAGCHGSDSETPTSSSVTSTTSAPSTTTEPAPTTDASTPTSEPSDTSATGVTTSTASTTSTTSTSAAAGGPIAIPDVTGKNAEAARMQLTNAGFTNVTYTSVDPDHPNVQVLATWNVQSVSPAPGTSVDPGTQVVLNVVRAF